MRPLREGLKRLKAADADVILMNPQYAPKVIAKHEVGTDGGSHRRHRAREPTSICSSDLR